MWLIANGQKSKDSGILSEVPQPKNEILSDKTGGCYGRTED
jgi:hypothetical protein